MLLLLFFIISILILVFTPFNEDVLLSFGSSYQGHYYSHFPQSLYTYWNLRGLGYKVYISLLRIVLEHMTSTQHLLRFQVFGNIFYYSFFLGMSFVAFYMLRKVLAPIQDWKVCFVFFVASLATICTEVHLQAEEMGLFVVLMMAAFAFSERKSLQLLSGLFVPLLFLLKVITILYAGFVYVPLLFFYRKNLAKTIPILASGAIFSVAWFAVYAHFFPQELIDTAGGLVYQSTISHSVVQTVGRFVIRTPEWLIINCLYMPVMGLGLWATFGFLRKRYAEKQVAILISVVALYAIPYVYVFLQHKFFIYHYMPFLVPVFIVLALTTNRLETLLPRLFVLWFALECVASPWILNNEESFISSYRFNASILSSSEKIKHVIPIQETILLLSGGEITFFIHNQSYLREPYPLPIQRAQIYPEVAFSPLHLAAVHKALAYQGRYVILQKNWFRLSYPTELRDKLQSEYRSVYEDKVYQVFERTLPRAVFK